MNRKVFSGMVLTLLLLGVLALALDVQSVEASGTIYIRADGSVDPPANITSADKVTYYFTDNNYDEIVVERSNIIVDGHGYTLQGSGSGYGFYLSGIYNVTIQNTNIKDFGYGIYVYQSSFNTVSGNNITNITYHGVVVYWSSYSTVSGNTITNNGYGVYVYESSYNFVSGNTITNNNNYGVQLSRSSNNVLRNNIMAGNSYNFGVEGYTLSHFTQDVDDSNTVDGKPIYYWVDRQNMEVPSDAGYVALVNSYNITIRGLELKNNYEGVLLAFTTNSHMTNNNVTDNYYGVYLSSSSFTTVSGNKITNNYNYGVYLSSSSNNSVSGNNITNNWCGVYLHSSSDNSVSGNNITNNNNYGVWLSAFSNNNSVSGNNITNNGRGVWLYSSSNNVFRNNIMASNSYNFGAEGSKLSHFIHDVDVSNTVDSKPMYYLINQRNLVIDPSTYPNIGYLGLVNSTNITVEGLELKSNGQGILLAYTNNSQITNNSITNNEDGVFLYSSSNNSISGNTITNNTRFGVWLWSSSDINLTGNTITNNTYRGVALTSSSYNTLTRNTITNNTHDGVTLGTSSYNTVSGNTIANNTYRGIALGSSSNNSISGNTIINNTYEGLYLASYNYNNSVSGNTVANNFVGVRLYLSSDNKFYHNNFIDNTRQVYIEPGPEPGYANFWDDGYPSGGNYWSDYTGVDLYSGPYQNITGSDSIGDTPYTIDANNQDRYPIMKTWPPHQINQTSVHIACKDYPITIESNATITKVVANPATLHFKTSGPDGTVAYIKVTFPVELNKTAIKVFVDGVKLTYPPYPIITTNSTHYFIYFEFTQSTHDMIIQYAVADIEVASVTPSKTVVGQGYTLTINATIQNQGSYTENFNATVYANTTTIATLTNITLTNGTSTILTFTWNTTDFPKGTYTISAYATPVPGEMDTADNNLTDGWVIVAMVGDVNVDGIVNIIDLATIGASYGTIVGDALYKPNADINDDGIIDILDLAICARNYGKTDP